MDLTQTQEVVPSESCDFNRVTQNSKRVRHLAIGCDIKGEIKKCALSIYISIYLPTYLPISIDVLQVRVSGGKILNQHLQETRYQSI